MQVRIARGALTGQVGRLLETPARGPWLVALMSCQAGVYCRIRPAFLELADPSAPFLLMATRAGGAEGNAEFVGTQPLDDGEAQAERAIRRILVVDDDEDSCANLADILVDCGYVPHVASNGNDALRLANRHHYAMVLLDYYMPQMDGVELYRRLKDIQEGVQGILVTAFATVVVQEAALAAGVRSIVRKPLDAAELLRVVHETLDPA